MDYKIAMPSKPRIVLEEENKGVYEIDGLYAGYGYTLGNSLRRIILSSIPGAAITAVKIEGVPHEFSKITGIKEDVITILLNFKKIRFKIHTDEPQKATISVNGIKEVTAKDISTSSQVEVVNKDEHIATLTSKDAKLNVEITIEKGLGYVSRENLHKEKVEIGVIILDAIFTPIRRVNYEVENMRIGERTDYNQLRFFIETDGTISPREALEKSIEIIINHLRAITGFKEILAPEEAEAPAGVRTSAISAETGKSKAEEMEILKTKIENMHLSSRTLNALSETGIRTAGGLVRKKEEDLLEIEGIGKRAVQEIKRALGNFGLTLK
ncbi:MAG: DNA-directed RNA polymerase subunit alpha [Candidatus Terrybacteria bacterium]|nr:DNA-directed RNA polymerase subunit alpha [Candidatus Terrybacteria bacterium]